MNGIIHIQMKDDFNDVASKKGGRINKNVIHKNREQ